MSKIITLCGSIKFKDEFIAEQKRLTPEGNIVISVGLFGHSGDNKVWSESTKEMLSSQSLITVLCYKFEYSSRSSGVIIEYLEKLHCDSMALYGAWYSSHFWNIRKETGILRFQVPGHKSGRGMISLPDML